MDVTRAATSIQVRWRYVHKCLPDLLRLLRMIPATAPEKLEPLRRRLRPTDGGGAVGSPGVLTVSRGRHPGSLHACMHREALSFATFAAFGAAVREHNAGGKETPARPFMLPDEKGAYAALAELLDARPVVGVMGGYHPPTPVEAYFALGAQLARDGFHVLTGGGGTMAGGPVTSLLAGFSSVRDRAGRAIGVVPEDMREGLNPFNDTLIFTNLPAGHAHPNSRNHLNVLLSDAIVALAGGPGTLHEIGLARHYGRALAADCYWSKIAAVPDEVWAHRPLAMHLPCIASAALHRAMRVPRACRATHHASDAPRHATRHASERHATRHASERHATLHKVDALPADGFGFLGMPKFWEASGGAAAAAAAGGGGGGLRLTADGRRTREGVAEQMCGLESHCYFTSLEALPYVASEAQRTRMKRA